MSIIDRSLPQFAHIPYTLEGEFLLEETPAGWITCSPAVAKYMKDAPMLERMQAGYDKYTTALNKASAVLNSLPTKSRAEIKALIKAGR